MSKKPLTLRELYCAVGPHGLHELLSIHAGATLVIPSLAAGSELMEACKLLCLAQDCIGEPYDINLARWAQGGAEIEAAFLKLETEARAALDPSETIPRQYPSALRTPAKIEFELAHPQSSMPRPKETRDDPDELQ